MGFNARVLKDFHLDFYAGEILPPELVSYLTRTCKIMNLVEKGEIEVGRES